TASGRICFVGAPDHSDIYVPDMAASLARICRYGGNLLDEISIYTVAQHAVLVSYHVPAEYALDGLLHDCLEFALGDPTRPLSPFLGGEYQMLKQRWEMAIGSVCGLGSRLAFLHPCVRKADMEAVATERRDLVNATERPWQELPRPWPSRIVPLSPFDARELF